MHSTRTLPSRLIDLGVLGITFFAAWEMLPPQQRQEIRTGLLGRLSIDLAKLARAAGLAGLSLERHRVPGAVLLYGFALRARLASTSAWEVATNVYR